MGLPCQSSSEESTLPMQGAQVRSLVRKLDPTCHTRKNVSVADGASKHRAAVTDEGKDVEGEST